MRLPALLSSLALAGAAALVATPAAAAPPPACGDLLTVDTTLVADLACLGDGLRLAPGVTLDLGGHTLSGPGIGTGVGVPLEGTSTVRNGTLSDWGVAVRTVFPPWEGEEAPSGPLVVRHVTFQDSGIGLDASGDGTGHFHKDTTVVKSSFEGNTLGLLVEWYGSVAVDRSTFSDNVNAASNGSGSARITRSTFVRNSAAFIANESVNEIERSTFVDNATAVLQGNLGWVSISRSDFTGSTTAVDVLGAAADISDSTFRSNTTAVDLRGELTYGSVVGSTFTGNGTTIRFSADPGGSVVVQDNRFRGNTDGLYVAAGDPRLQIGGNDARHNTGWGLHVPGATDLGGNTARHNGNTPQCVGVVCSTS